MSLIYYRKPHDTTIYRNRCTDEPEELQSLVQLNGRSGFVIAPFAVAEECPILLLKADFETVSEEEAARHCNGATDGCTLDEDALCKDTLLSEDTLSEGTLSEGTLNEGTSSEANSREDYSEDFRRFHQALEEGRFAKLVLARNATVSRSSTDNSPISLFYKACTLYPRMFIALFSTKRSGTWLIATPETLLAGSVTTMSTMALAGTMRLDDADRSFDTLDATVGQQDIRWSSKNIREQRFVETYLTERIATFASECTVNGPYTVRAGDLVHLRSDIAFTPKTTQCLGDILDILHPTPAVCGIPKEEATQFILANEHGSRSYYSGFSGIIAPDGDTFLYVTLRCMSIAPEGRHRLYAGGGLLVESEEEKEWAETEAKMGTMMNLL